MDIQKIKMNLIPGINIALIIYETAFIFLLFMLLTVHKIDLLGIFIIIVCMVIGLFVAVSHWFNIVLIRHQYETLKKEKTWYLFFGKFIVLCFLLVLYLLIAYLVYYSMVTFHLTNIKNVENVSLSPTLTYDSLTNQMKTAGIQKNLYINLLREAQKGSNFTLIDKYNGLVDKYKSEENGYRFSLGKFTNQNVNIKKDVISEVSVHVPVLFFKDDPVLYILTIIYFIFEAVLFSISFILAAGIDLKEYFSKEGPVQPIKYRTLPEKIIFNIESIKNYIQNMYADEYFLKDNKIVCREIKISDDTGKMIRYEILAFMKSKEGNIPFITLGVENDKANFKKAVIEKYMMLLYNMCIVNYKNNYLN